MKKILVLLISVSSLSLVSCIGGNGGLNPNFAPQAISNVKGILDTLPKSNAVGSLPSQISNGSGGVSISSFGAEAMAGGLACHKYTPNTIVDADADSMPALREYTFDCDKEYSSNYTYTHKGSMKITDKDDSVKGIKGGYHYEYDLQKWEWTDLNEKTSFSGSHKGYWDAKGTDTESEFKSEYGGTTKGELPPKYGGLKYDYTFAFTYNLKYTHDSVASGANWSAGKIEGSGTYKFFGTFPYYGRETDVNPVREVRSGGATASWRYENVEFDRAGCTKWYKSGRLILNDMTGSEVRLEFKCTSVEVYLNDVKLDYEW